MSVEMLTVETGLAAVYPLLQLLCHDISDLQVSVILPSKYQQSEHILFRKVCSEDQQRQFEKLILWSR